MFGVGIAEVVVLLVLMIGLVGLVVFGLISLTVRLLGHGASVPVVVAREWRLVQATRVAGLVAGLGAAVLVTQLRPYGGGPMLAPAAVGLCVLLATALGETVVRPRREPGPRSASLVPRRIRDYLPPVLTPVVVVMTVVAAATLTLTTITASRDNRTGSMRALTCTGATTTGSHTPYPGSYYSVPLLAALVLVLVVAAVAAVQVVRRPRGMAGSEQGDDALRRRSLGVVIAATGLAVCAPLAGLALVGGAALTQLPQQTVCPGWMAPAGTAALLVGLAALVVSSVCVVRLLSGAPDRVPADREAVHR